MQILKWLSRTVQQPQKIAANSSLTSPERSIKVDSNDIVVLMDRGSRRRRSKKGEEALNLLCFLQRKDVSKACFYHTLNLKRFGGRQHCARWMKKKKKDGDHRAECATHAGNKVLPITDHQCSDSDKKEKRKVEKTKPVSRMKELVRWAASSKAEKGGKFSNGRKVSLLKKTRAALKEAWGDEDEVSNDSPRISFTSADTEKPVAGTGNWITNDSEFVVLEL